MANVALCDGCYSFHVCHTFRETFPHYLTFSCSTLGFLRSRGRTFDVTGLSGIIPPRFLPVFTGLEWFLHVPYTDNSSAINMICQVINRC